MDYLWLLTCKNEQDIWKKYAGWRAAEYENYKSDRKDDETNDFNDHGVRIALLTHPFCLANH